MTVRALALGAALLFSCAMAGAWVRRVQAERAAVVVAKEDLAEARQLLQRLEAARDDESMAREKALLRDQLAQLGGIAPPSEEETERLLGEFLIGRGLRLNRLDVLQRRPTEFTTHDELSARLLLEPTDRPWLTAIDLGGLPAPVFTVQRLLVPDPRDPQASLVMDVTLTLRP